MHSIADLRNLFEAYLKDNAFAKEPEELYTPINYIMGLGGKRLRPILVLLAYEMFDSQVKKALPIAYAVEIFHNFSLVHDDIMDEAPLRRGKASVHHKYGLSAGILSGDVMLIYAYEYLLKIGDNASVKQLIEVFNRISIAVCEGQQMDMNFESRDDVTIPEYLKMIELKTAELMSGSLEMGAIAAGASLEDTRNLAQFGRNIGIAFQLQDDILDTFGDPSKFGKKVGGDISQNKKTYLLLKAQELADAKTKALLEGYMQDTTVEEAKKIREVTAIFQDLEIPMHAKLLKAHYREEALKNLSEVQLPGKMKQQLLSLTDSFIDREQ